MRPRAATLFPVILLLALAPACGEAPLDPESGRTVSSGCPPGKYCVYLPRVSSPSGPETRRYLLVVYDPVLESQGGVRLIDHQRWNSPDQLAASYAARVNKVSHGMVTYLEAGRLELDAYPVKEDGFQYTDTSFLACLANKSSCHKPDMKDGFGYAINYPAMLAATGACTLLNDRKIDELWVFASPFMGLWEANQAGAGAFSTNGPVVTGTACNGILNIMGFSYQRGLAEMLEDLGHRAEGTMRHFYGAGATTTWASFIRNDLVAPGGAQCGSVHIPPNGVTDYDWSNPHPVTSACETWLSYPSLSGQPQTVTCTTWGCSAEGYQDWWLSHLPHAPGTGPDGKQASWWSYVVTR